MLSPQSALDEMNAYVVTTAQVWGVPVGMMQQAVGRSLEKGRAVGFLSRIFNGKARPVREKISFISRWIAHAQITEAPWLSEKNEQGQPHLLAGKSVNQLYKMARKASPEIHALLPDIEGSTDEHWPVFTTQTPAAFYQQMTKGLPQGVHLTLRLLPDGMPAKIYYYHAQKGARLFSFMRDFSYLPQEKIVTHTFANVDESIRNGGIAKIINAHLFHLYQRLKLDKIVIRSVDIGTYAWGRAGFAPWKTSWSDLKLRIGKRLDLLVEHMPSIPAATIDVLRKALASDEPKNYWQLVDQDFSCHGTTLGKVLALPLQHLPDSAFKKAAMDKGLRFAHEWDGTLDLHDKEAVARFETYHGISKKKPALVPKLPAPLTAA